MDHIDWNVELRRIMRQFEGLPPEPTPEELRVRHDARQVQRSDRETMALQRGMLVRIAPVFALGAALPFWPYAARCGGALFAHLGGISMLIVGGTWCAAYAWRRRMPASYLLSLVALLWALTLVAHQVLPRTSYAAPRAGAAHWRCTQP